MKIVSFNDFNELKNELDNDKVIAFPTETVFGLGARCSSLEAFNNLVKVKNRRPDKPFTLMCGDVNQIKKYGEVNKLAESIIEKFIPGPITILIKPKNNIPEYLHLGSDSIGFRIPNNKELQSFLIKYGTPIFAPSANKSDMKPAKNVKEVINYFDNEIDYVIYGKCDINVPSTIIKITGNDILLIREGPISLEEIKKEIDYENNFRK